LILNVPIQLVFTWNEPLVETLLFTTTSAPVPDSLTDFDTSRQSFTPVAFQASVIEVLLGALVGVAVKVSIFATTGAGVGVVVAAVSAGSTVTSTRHGLPSVPPASTGVTTKLKVEAGVTLSSVPVTFVVSPVKRATCDSFALVVFQVNIDDSPFLIVAGVATRLLQVGTGLSDTVTVFSTGLLVVLSAQRRV
jgi:hypothetical protein